VCEVIFFCGAAAREGVYAALGFPLGTLMGDALTVTGGNIASLSGIGGDAHDLQVTAPVQPGNSGGPLLDRRGALLGVVTSRLDDAVIVENEWGWVEELTLTYVVVRLWDWRRLVLPINYFIEKPFQNWTRSSAELIGSVFFYVDYAIPLAALREELTRVLGQTPLWDGKVKVLQVVDTTERTMVLRALASARSAPQLWDLRCFVREHLIDFIQREYPESLPRLRAQFDAPATGHDAPQPSAASSAKEPV
jgi:hypothetical protein